MYKKVKMALKSLQITKVCCWILLVFVILLISLPSVSRSKPLLRRPDYDLQKIKQEIASYKDVANEIMAYIVNGSAKGQVYNRLALFTDTFGNRLVGTKNLENSIDFMLNELQKDGLQNVHGEEVVVPHWVRGNESAVMLEPRRYNLIMLGLGSSVGTPPEGITAEAIVVSSFDELKKRASEVPGKIVVFNQPWVNYGVSVAYRDFAAVNTAKLGGVASLVRSIAAFSIHSPHTGWQDYSDSIKKIPTACIAVEDAEMLARMAARGTKIVIQLKMEAKTYSQTISRNTVAEVVGSVHPEEVVLVSGHLDSWDVGQGAMDDGGGAFISWQALSIVKQLGLRPKRTMRMVMWTGEEVGGVGSLQYYQRHKANASNYDLVLESDMGTFTPYGIEIRGSNETLEIVKGIVELLGPVNATTFRKGEDGLDVSYWEKDGVPGGSLLNHNEHYFWFHHSDGDTMSVQDPHQMDLCAAVWTVVSYIVADLDNMLPRK
ncbi:carboxypeptidase Q-like [Acanthaster planci]|uniref:Carboxypeptidase Q n=1 Tax=Acanthaster planci TaxID=133434 RepID=A0A8B7Y337_ACAPL|nr:carboxypeptidase Q-like [Acanthaster planci]